jgi:hypothetical protein
MGSNAPISCGELSLRNAKDTAERTRSFTDNEARNLSLGVAAAFSSEK